MLSTEQAVERQARHECLQAELLAALEEAREFINRHSEPWYTSGQALLAEVDAVIAKAKGQR